MTANAAPHPLKRLYAYAAPHRARALRASLYSTLNKVFDVLPEILIGVAVDVVVNQRESFLARLGIVEPMTQLIWLTGLTIVIWALESLFEYLYAINWRGLAQDLQHGLRQAAYEHLQKLPPDAIARARSGRLMALMNEDINQVERFVNTGANDLIQVVVSSVLVGAVFFVMTPTLAVLAILPIPLIVIGAFWFQARLAPRYAAAREAAATLSARLDNNLRGMATIQAYTAEDFEAGHLRAASDGYRRSNAEAIRFAAAITPVIRLAILIGFVATLLYGGWLTLQGRLGVGSYSALVYLTQRLLWPMTRLADMTDLYNRAMASVQRVLDLLDTPTPVRAGGQLPAPATGAVRFEDIRFAYADRPALAGVSFELPAGATVALVGATGSGKSTLLKLLLRFLDPQSGRVLLDGNDIADIDPSLLRGRIAYVAQEPFLTDGSVADNIAYGDRHPDASRIEAAARSAEAHDFIARLPGGYQHAVGEAGSELSGGQRQRIALARALYRDPLVLVLDEATSAIDNETEAAIAHSLRSAAQGCSVLVVAHRLSTVRHADCIHVLDHGRILESGRHEELLARNGQYARLWRLQTGEI
jgi:ATP-binding cassette, subfamily B, bacterial